MKATSRGEYRQAVYGNCSYRRYSFTVMIDKDAFESVFVAVQESPGQGEGSKRIGRLTKGSMAKARRSPNISPADTVKILYDGAADKADVYTVAAVEGCEIVTPVRIDSSSKASPGRKNALPEAPGPEAPGPEAPPGPPMIDGEMLRRQAVYKQNGGLDSITPENKAKLDAMSGEERDEHRLAW